MHELQTIQATRIMMGILPFRYLGVLLNSRKMNLANCEPLIKKIKVNNVLSPTAIAFIFFFIGYPSILDQVVSDVPILRGASSSDQV